MKTQSTIPASVWRQVLFAAAAPLMVVGLVIARSHRAHPVTNGPQAETVSQRTVIAKPVLPFSDTLMRGYALKSGAVIRLSDLHGPVRVHTSPLNHAALIITRYAATAIALKTDTPKIETSDHAISVVGDLRALPSGETPVQYKLDLTVPRTCSLALEKISGDIAVDSLGGSLTAHHINGNVTIADVDRSQEFTDINGDIDARLTQPHPGALRIAGVNGRIQLHKMLPTVLDYQFTGITGDVVRDPIRRPGNMASSSGGTNNAAVQIARVNGDVVVVPRKPLCIMQAAE